MLKMKLRLLCLLCLLLLLVTAVSAQGQRVLVPGTPLQGRLDDNTLVQVYTLEGQANQVVTISVVNEISVPLALILTDSSGTTLGQTFDNDVTGQVTLTNTKLPATGTYYVTIFKSAGVTSVNLVEFTVTVTVAAAPTATVAPAATATVAPASTTSPSSTQEASGATFTTGQVVTTSGLTVQLSWNTTDDLDLEVRDPVGGSLYWETPTVNSGGTISANANQGCANTTTAPTETASWAPGGIPTGSYEVLVYYQKACAGGAPVNFSIATTVDGKTLDPISSTIASGQVFVASFIVKSDDTASLTGLSGIVNDNLPDTAAAIMKAATPIQIGNEVSGIITDQQPYQSYSFSAQANDVVTMDMNAHSGSLDTFLFLLDPDGNVVSLNDDVSKGHTDSEISNAVLPTAGTYTIVATRYAKKIGGTEGGYTLVVSSQSNQLPSAYLNLPQGALEIRLLWNNAADLQLLVRDPAGQSVYVDKPQITSGGQMVALGNNNCTPPQGTPFSYTYWPTTTPPRPGVYEVQVWFKNQCNDTSPVTAHLYINYNGKQVITDTTQPILNDRFLTSFTITADGQVQPSEGGIIDGITSLDYQSQVEGAATIAPGTPRNGSITQDSKFQLYVFTAKAGETYSIAMNNTSGNLDPSLYLIGPGGDQVAANDDAVPGTDTNSLISNLTLPADGQYIIIATHFGARYGGTTGTYSLTLTKTS
ncbi:MAG TPA: PPC domain-containing protein [Phototrophicaceae bacterium]|nr:PPC domain-containing protein [Phototrophicaceae bacterium]